MAICALTWPAIGLQGRVGGPGRGRGGGDSNRGRGGSQQGRGGGGQREPAKKESILDLSKYMDKKVRVKFTGGRECGFNSVRTTNLKLGRGIDAKTVAVHRHWNAEGI